MEGRASAEALRANNLEATAALAADELAALRQERDTAVAFKEDQDRRARLAGLEDVADVTDAELAAIDPTDLKVMQGLSKRQLMPIIKALMTDLDLVKVQLEAFKPLANTVSDVAKNQQVVNAKAAAVDERAYFDNALKNKFPDWQKTVALPEWKVYLSENVDPANDAVKRGHMLSEYRTQKHLPGIFAMFEAFEAQRTTRPGFESLVTPANAGQAPGEAAPVRRKSSEYVAKQKAFLRDKTLSAPDWEKFKQKFLADKAKGLVDDDANIIT
jgi:hypothetical protein